MKITVLLIALAALGASGCASLGGPRHTAAVSVVTAHAVLSAVQDTEMGLVCGRSTAPAPPACVPLAQHRDISARLAKAFSLEVQVAQFVRLGQTDVSPLIGEIRTLLDAVLALIPPSPPRTALLANIGGR
jgi:hypothetical protein